MEDSRIKLYLYLSVLAFLGWSATAQSYKDQIGQTLLQATTTNINGAGISVGQPESIDPEGNPTLPEFEVNPATVGQPVSLFTYISSNGVSTTFPNTVGIESTNHANGVADGWYSIYDGVSSNVAHVYNYEALDYTFNFVAANVDTYKESVVNQSFSFETNPISVQEQYDAYYDNYEENYHTLFVTGNGDTDTTEPPFLPATAYNLLSVAAYDNGLYYSHTGPTLDNKRCKPDISGISGAASFACNQVSGATTVLKQAALRGDGGTDTNSAFNNCTTRALILNGAVKPLGWTNSPLFPLDARYGAGVVNVYNSYRILAGGKHGSASSNTVTVGTAHLPLALTNTITALSGWDFNTNTSNSNPAKDAIYHYYFNVSNNVAGVKYIATATLVWNRHVSANVFNPIGINNLNLYLYDCANNNLISCSTSLVNNVEHLFVTNLNQGRYDLQVWKAGGTFVTAGEPYALAWQFVPPSQANVKQSGGNAVLTWPMYPAGYLVEATTSLTFPAWNTIDLSNLVYTNNTNSLTFAPTGATQFYRLRYPNL